mmetsp:Transcript_22574/g.37175  ORF Transcript_22574/g.37175 Transcript_22574/m.37175 type:complete len:296 (-) Transcript_22574:474-1361(-)
MVLRDLPFAILEDINVSVTSLNLLSGSSHSEFVDTSILCPVGSNDDVSVEDFSLGLQLEEVCEVVNLSEVVVTRNIRNSGEENTLLAVSGGNLLGILGSKSVVPKAEETADLLLSDWLSCDNSLGHDTGVVVVDLPFSVLVNVDKTVTSLNLLSGCSHCELVDTNILAPVVSNSDMALQDLSLRLQLQEMNEIVLNAFEISPWCIRHGREKHSLRGITRSDLLGVKSSKSIVPKAEKSSHLVLSDSLAHGNLLWHNTRMVVLNLPDAILLYVVVSITSLHLVASGAHGELINSGI